MTKDEVLTDVENLINSLVDKSPMGQVYEDGFRDGAKYALKKLQQYDCSKLLPSVQEMIDVIEVEKVRYPRMWTADVLRLLHRVKELAAIA